jgi:ATP-dependent RNA helicase DeaD
VPAIRPKHERPENTAWFRLNVGRKDNADPKWILPLICRIGGVTKKDIGSIKIFDGETKFELDVASVDGFVAAVRASGETETQFEPTSPPGQGAFRPGPPRYAGKRPDQGGFAKPAGRPEHAGFAKPAGRPEHAGFAKPPGRPGFKKPFKAGKPKRAGV